MSNLNAFTTINMFEAITAPLQKVPDKLDRLAKACSVATAGLAGVANASAALQNVLKLGAVEAPNGMGKAASAMEAPPVGQGGLEQAAETTNETAKGVEKLVNSISVFRNTAKRLTTDTLDPFGNALSGIIDRVNEWCKSNPNLTGTIFASVVGVKALAVGTWGAIYAIGKMGNTVGSTIEGFDEWPKNMERIKGALKRFWPFKGKAAAMLIPLKAIGAAIALRLSGAMFFQASVRVLGFY